MVIICKYGKHSNGYKHIKSRLVTCNSKEERDFYLSIAKDLFKTVKISGAELSTLEQINNLINKGKY